MKPLPPSRGDRFWGYDHERFAITVLMESLARACGDVDELVDVVARDLSSPYAFVRIGEVLVEAERHDEALEWIERGLRAYGAAADERLRRLAAAEYRRRDESERAVELAVRSFGEKPGSGAFAELKAAAEETAEWPALRARALSALTGDALIRAYLVDGDPEAAWVEATHGGASEGMGLELAALRREAHPDDSLPVYRRALERELEYANPRGYQDVIDRLEDVHSCLALAGREEEFPAEVSAVREEYRRRPKLVKMLEAQGW